jgi:cell division protein FtsI (penicillin-binding protein 3)
MTKGNSLLRIKFLMVIFTIFLIAITYQLYQLQIVNGAEFRNRADLQYVGTSASNFDRGTIYIKNNIGNKFPIASVASGYRLAIHPALVTNPDKVARQIYAVLDPAEQDSVSEAEFVERFVARASRTDDSYEEILTQLSVDTGETINDLDLPGVNVYGDRWRHYPAGKLLSHVVGFISYNQDDERVGTYGLEREYESLLARGNESIFTNFFAEAFSTVQSVVNDNLSADLYLTIDRSVQIELEKTLADTAIKWHTKKTAGIVMDPKTGAIVGMAATPDFDLNTFNQVDSASIYVNPLVENVYEMGSIMKPLTMAYALDSGVVTPATHYNDTGQIKVDGFTISNYDKRARGNVPVQEVLNQSLNVGTAFLVNTMGHDVFKKYFLKSGFDEVTEIDLPNEAGPLTEALLESPRRVEYVTASFGQGFAISPIAMARALSIIANGGKLPSPYIVERVQHELGTWDDMRQDQKQTQVISAAAAKTTTDMLVTVVDEALAGGDESLRNYSIAAKTGTAQIANQSGSYREDAYLHTFFGFFPAHNPRYLIFLLNEEPRGARYASETLTDPFMSLTKFLINYQNLEPDR